MGISRDHVEFYNQIFSLPDFLGPSVFVFGYHQCDYSPRPFRRRLRSWASVRLRQLANRFQGTVVDRRERDIPEEFQAEDLSEVLSNFHVNETTVMDLFDPRADIRLDMNEPLPNSLVGKYKTVIDIGSTEHVYDTRQCLQNLLSLVDQNGHILLHLPCKGYFDHGFHTFSPECIQQTLVLNGFRIVLEMYTTPFNHQLSSPSLGSDVLMWTVAKLEDRPTKFAVPQQGRWTQEWYVQQ